MPPRCASHSEAQGGCEGFCLVRWHLFRPQVRAILQQLGAAPGHLLMLCCRVSLGRVGAPSSQMRIAPPGYQSVGEGHGRQPSTIYAVFDNFQACPPAALHVCTRPTTCAAVPRRAASPFQAYPEWVVVYNPQEVGGQAAQAAAAQAAATSAAMAAMAAAGAGGAAWSGLGAFPGMSAASLLSAGVYGASRGRKRGRRG